MPYKDKEKEREYQRLYKKAHREKMLEYNRLYYQAYKEEATEYSRLYRQAHPEYHREWRDEHKRLGLCYECSRAALPFNIRCAWHYDSNLRAARKYTRNHSEEINKYVREYHQRMKDEGRCPSCGIPVHESIYCPACNEATKHGSKRRRSFAITYV